MGVAHHRATDRGGRRRDGGTPVASTALAIGDGRIGIGSGVIPARCAGSRCSTVRHRDILTGVAGGARSAAHRGILPGRAAHTRRIRFSALLAGRTGLEGLVYKCAAEESAHSSRFLQSKRHHWHSVNQQAARRETAKAKGTIGTPSISKQQDEKQLRVWRMTWQVFELAVTLP
jgi:hypothetical protein